MLAWWKAVRLGIALAAAIVALTSCVSAGLVDFDTAQTLPPGHLGISGGAESSNLDGFPEIFDSVHVGLPFGAELGARAGLGTLLAELKYHIPFAWKRAAFAIALAAGANFGQEVKQVDTPVIFSYRFNKSFAVTASQTTTLYFGGYSGFAVSAGGGVKWNIGRFYLFPKLVLGYLSPSGGPWSEVSCSGRGGIVGLCYPGPDLAKPRGFGSLGSAVGYAF